MGGKRGVQDVARKRCFFPLSSASFRGPVLLGQGLVPAEA